MQNLSRHFKEAIQLNTDRMPLYAELSDGKTLPFTKELIGIEKRALFFSRILDNIGEKYQKKGVPFLEMEFVEMSLTPEFSETYPEGIDYKKPLVELDLQPFKKIIREYIRERNYEGILSICKELLGKLSAQIHVYCMVRHLVESMHRIASLIPVHEQKCKALQIKPPSKWSWLLIRAHLFLLPRAEKLDKNVAPIQNQNIPFLFQDLPMIFE